MDPEKKQECLQRQEALEMLGKLVSALTPKPKSRHRFEIGRGEPLSLDFPQLVRMPGASQNLKGRVDTLETTSAGQERVENNRLPRKGLHLTRYFVQAGLTDRQRDCLSLYYERNVTMVKIARRLGLHHATVREHIAVGLRKLSHIKGLARKTRTTPQKSPESLARSEILGFLPSVT